MSILRIIMMRWKKMKKLQRMIKLYNQSLEVLAKEKLHLIKLISKRMKGKRTVKKLHTKV